MKDVTVGTIVNTHGLKGEVKVKVNTHFVQERFAKKAHIILHSSQGELELIVKSTRFQKEMLLVCFEGYDHINLVEAWKGCRLSVREDQLQELDDDEIYYHELKEMQVYNEDGTLLGKVSEIIETGANVVIRVQGETELLIPYVKAFIKRVDKPNKCLYVTLLEGML